MAIAMGILVVAATGPAIRDVRAQYVAQAPDTVLVSNSLANVTRREYDAEVSKLPAEIREGFANNPKRVNELLTRLLLQKSLAAKARAAKLDVNPDNAARIALEVDRQLATLEVEALDRAASREFDANIATYEARARELYLVNKASYTDPPLVNASHILFDTTKRSSADARRMAEEARAKLVAGADFAALAKEVSDDPGSSQLGGALGWFPQAKMEPTFGAAAFALEKTGDLSPPVQTQYGWHIIRLDGKQPAKVMEYPQARDRIMADLRNRYVQEKRDIAMGAIRNDPKTDINQPAVDALIPKVDRDAVQRALERAKSAPSAAPPQK